MPGSVTAFSLLVLEADALSRVTAALESDPAVAEARPVMGAYDMVVKVRADTLQELHEFIFTRLRGIEGIRSTTTLIAQSPAG